MPDVLSRLSARSTLRVAGLMSGTSADGVDCAIVDLSPSSLRLRAFDTFPYPPRVRRQLFDLFDHSRARVDDLCHLNFLLGELFAQALIRLARSHRIPLRSIHLVGSHGQTVCHIPRSRRYRSRNFPSTLQIAEPSVIAERTGITTVADFRPRDIAAGGQGAPLVPFADFLLLAHPTLSRAVQNVGGIANVTFLPASPRPRDVLAFDTGPGNMIIDRLASRITAGRSSFDRAGRLAARGSVNPRLLARLLRHPFLKLRPPKSCGREQFGLHFADRLFDSARSSRIPPLDLLATATAFTARSIALAYRRFLPSLPDELILCGGGAHNLTLRAMLARELPSSCSLRLIDDLGIPTDAKEAVSFALLARHTLLNLPNNLPSATGASHPVVLGKIILASRSRS